MINFNKHVAIGIIGAGTMGTGIAQVAATFGHRVVIFDQQKEQLNRSHENLTNVINRLVNKQKIDQRDGENILSRVTFTNSINDLASMGLIIEAIVEDLEVKKELFANLEDLVNENCFLATNTSSLSITSIAAACRIPQRVIGLHFFNPPPLMPLVEIVPGILTGSSVKEVLFNLMKEWGKVPVVAKDTPGFIVNKVARSFYGEALRIYEEGIADIPRIDYAMKRIGKFRMGPFELMDLIGNDVNYKVTETVFREFYYDQRYKPSITQKRYVEAGLYGRKSGKGFYDYTELQNAQLDELEPDSKLDSMIFERIIVMLINEAADTLMYNIASKEDIDLAMLNGVNYPKGLFKWADELGLDFVASRLSDLYEMYHEDRYRTSPIIAKMAKTNEKFYPNAKDF
ncbi:MAG: 3-hydroxybutyryl-CoA dehydrogenase [Ignavibacteriae bacterium HGW-Ignavibacteriae-1]|nr:MAG: 3-hydroxybutyryl-CoA dehydrogenase [Ignavibacteriae bacterium HGW-Ignavibacteriae-1]